MTALTRPNRRLEAAARQQQQGFSHLMGPLLHLHQVLLGKGCVTGWEPTPRAGGARAGELLLPSFPKQTCPGGGGMSCQRQELTAPVSQPTFISPPEDQAGSVSWRN